MDDSRGGLGLADSGIHEKPSSNPTPEGFGAATQPTWGAAPTQPISDEPTEVMPNAILAPEPPTETTLIADAPSEPPPAAEPATAYGAVTASEPHIKKPFRIWPRSRAKQATIIISLVLLVALAVPVVYTVTNALNDYHSLKALGTDAINHLYAAKDDLLGESSSAASSNASSSLGSLSSSLLTSGPLGALQMLLALPGPDVTDPAYTYLAQRQGGTIYPLQVTIHPAKGVPSEGTQTTTFKATVADNTYFALGGTPAPTPTPSASATATPSPTATSSPSNAGSSGAGGLTSRIPDQAHITMARADLLAAQQDFLTLGSRLDHPDEALSLALLLPVGKTDIHSLRALATVGVDATQAGVAMLDAATPLMLRLRGTTSLLSGATQLITEADITALSKGLAVVSAKVDDIVAQLKQVDVSALPLSAGQKALFTEIQPLLPQIKSLADQAVPLLQTFGWIIGADTTRNYLIQLQDTGELRAAGGFTGQYAVLALTGGKLGQINLQDVNCLDYGWAGPANCPPSSNAWTAGRKAPAPYNTWWPFANWGVRDSSLSADFPTNAQIVLNAFDHESGQHMDGVIDISPLAIEDVLRVVGPIQVPLYNETITADNLETKLHYYQQDPAAIALQQKLSGGGRKSFTNLVGQLLQQKVKALPTSMLAPLAEQMFNDIREKNIQIYFTDPASEALLTKYDLAGAVDTTPSQDGYMLVQENVSVSKAASFVNVTQSDDVTLDAKGGATHHLTVTFHGDYTYTQVWGYLTYRDYLRFYVPANAKLLSADGFDSGKPMCWPAAEGKAPSQYGALPVCSGDPYPNSEMYCPSGNYGPGTRAPDLFGSDGYNNWPVDQPSGPTNTKSDLTGRAMYGGYIMVPDGCTAKVTLSWYVPGVAPQA